MEKEALLNGLKGIRRQEIIPDAAYVKILSAAIKYIEDGWQSPSDNRGYSSVDEAGKKGEQLGEVEIIEHDYFNTDVPITVDTYLCPNCPNQVFDSDNYCASCGVKIKWVDG